MPLFFGCMEREFSNDRLLVGPADNLGANPVLVVRKPFIRVCFIEKLYEFLTSVSVIFFACESVVREVSPIDASLRLSVVGDVTVSGLQLLSDVFSW
jgi:hypothetical protein